MYGAYSAKEHLFVSLMSAALYLEWGRNGNVALLGEIVGVEKGLEVIHCGFSRRESAAH